MKKVQRTAYVCSDGTEFLEELPANRHERSCLIASLGNIVWKCGGRDMDMMSGEDIGRQLLIYKDDIIRTFEELDRDKYQ